MYRAVTKLADLPEMQRRQISHFLERYKELESGKWVQIEPWGNAEEAPT